jgi:hypothetical protein
MIKLNLVLALDYIYLDALNWNLRYIFEINYSLFIIKIDT